MTDAEVERIARLMHEKAGEWHAITGHPTANRSHRWEDIEEWYRERYRFTARAVLADLCPEPLIWEPKG
jgi:hypothetical protein